MSFHHEMEKQVCEALGLAPRDVRAIYIALEAGELAKVTVEMYVTNGDALAAPLRTYIRRCELKVVEETEPVPA